MGIIIGISGPTGAGKTTLAEALAKALQAPYIDWDDFDAISSPLQSSKEADQYNQWSYPQLAAILQAMKRGEAVAHPVTGEALPLSKYMIYEAPLGRLHRETGRYIDVAIHINTPLELLISRTGLRNLRSIELSQKASLGQLPHFTGPEKEPGLESDVQRSSDLIIDGTLPLAEQVALVQRYIFKRHK